MADPFKKLQVGDPLPRSATAWNAILDAARAERARQHDLLFQGPGHSRDAAIVRVWNTTGQDLPRRYTVLGLHGPVFNPGDNVPSLGAFLREVAFKGVVPAEADAGKFCVTLDPIPDLGVGRAVVAGVTPVRLDVADEDHTHADVADGSFDHLVTSATGTARILWKQDDGAYGYGYGFDVDYDTGLEDDTDLRWAIVRLGDGGGGGGPVGVIALTRDGGITAASASGSDITPGTGTVDTYTPISGPPLVLSLLGSAITAYNMVNVAIPGNTPVFLSYWAGKPWVTVLPCDFTIVDPYYS